MSNAYVIEINDEAIGLVVREDNEYNDRCSYRFYASSSQFLSLEGQIFNNPEKARKKAIALHDTA